VNANPSGSRTPSTGSRGESEARREVATTAVPSPSHARATRGTGLFRGPGRQAVGARGGTRRAMMVCRGALVKRRAAQGRVGELEPPRQVARHLDPHLLLSANTSALADAVRPHFPTGAGPDSGRCSRAPSTPSTERPSQERVPRLVKRRGTPSWSCPAATSHRRRVSQVSRGKGVLAA
jgi:hypothetical protein